MSLIEAFKKAMISSITREGSIDLILIPGL